MPTPEERLAVLETDIKYLRARTDDNSETLDEIRASLGRQKGFIAGAMFVLVPLWSAVLMIAKAFWDRVSS